MARMIVHKPVPGLPPVKRPNRGPWVVAVVAAIVLASILFLGASLGRRPVGGPVSVAVQGVEPAESAPALPGQSLEAFLRIRLGMTDMEVMKVLGPPDTVSRGEETGRVLWVFDRLAGYYGQYRFENRAVTRAQVFRKVGAGPYYVGRIIQDLP